MMSAQFSLPYRFLCTKEVARFTGVSRRTLEKHRSHGTGPKWSKVGGRVIYAVSDLEDWVGAVGAKRSAIDPARTAVLPGMLGTPEVARFLKVSVRTLERHRVYGTGPKFSKVGRRVFYAIDDVRAWAERGAKRSTSDPATVLPARPVDKHELRSGIDSKPSPSDFDATQLDTLHGNDLLSAPVLTESSRSVR
jgi:predicted DNA-binding transcriptional regulator AlpA